MDAKQPPDYTLLVKRVAINTTAGRRWRDYVRCKCGAEWDIEYAGIDEYSVPCPACGRHFYAHTADQKSYTVGM